MAKKKVIVKKAVVKKKAAPKKAAPKKVALKTLAKKAKVAKSKTKAPAKKTGAKKKKEDLMCFLTSACVQHYGLADDCVQLKTLRQYRDTYLMQTSAGKALVQEYYKVSPQIVSEIKKGSQQTQDYSFIYNQVNKAVKQISREAFESARITYTQMVRTLARKYKVDLEEAEK